jgi:hypothetical protein
LKTNLEVKLTNPIEEQRQVIDQLYRIVKGSCPVDVQKARCTFRYERFKDGSSRVEQEFYFTKNGKESSETLEPELRRPVMGLVKDLHAKMKSHTGGDWSEFTLFINQDGTVTSTFEYGN